MVRELGKVIGACHAAGRKAAVRGEMVGDPCRPELRLGLRDFSMHLSSMLPIRCTTCGCDLSQLSQAVAWAATIAGAGPGLRSVSTVGFGCSGARGALTIRSTLLSQGPSPN